LKSKNVATPLTAATGVVPPSVAPAGLLPSSTLTLPAKLVATLPSASSARTFTAGVMRRFATVVPGCWLNASCVAVPGVTPKTLLVAEHRPVVAAGGQYVGRVLSGVSVEKRATRVTAATVVVPPR